MLHFDPEQEAEYLRHREAAERKSANQAETDAVRRSHEAMADQYARIRQGLIEEASPGEPGSRSSWLVRWMGGLGR